MSIKDLIAAAYNKDATAFESAFQSVMQDKVSAAVQNAFTAEETDEDLDEEVEELDELSNKTLGSYKKGAQADQRISRKQFDASRAYGDYENMEAAAKSYNKRKAGLAMANKKMSEEVEELDEDELDEGSIKGSGADRKAQLKKSYRAGEQNTRDFYGDVDKLTPATKIKDKGISKAFKAGASTGRGSPTDTGAERSQSGDRLKGSEHSKSGYSGKYASKNAHDDKMYKLSISKPSKKLPEEVEE